MTIEDLEQLRLLSDPLKLSLVQVFGEAEGTVASAAEALGEPQTKLYRHVDALLDAGLIEVTRERPKRGTVERWFRTVARRFEVADDLLAGKDPGEERSVKDLLRGAEAELLQALREEDEQVPPTFARFRARVTPEQLKELQDRLFIWLDKELQDAPEDNAETVEIGAVIALYKIAKG